jgi:hypothetical protein
MKDAPTRVGRGSGCGQSVVTGKAAQRQLQNQLCRARRPTACTLDLLNTLQEATKVDEKIAEFRADRVDRPFHPPTGGQNRVGQIGNPAVTGPSAPCDGGIPVRGYPRHQLRPREIGPQTLARLKLRNVEKRSAIGTFPLAEPGKRGFPRH